MVTRIGRMRPARIACVAAVVALAVPASVGAQTRPESFTFTATPARAGGPVTVSFTLRTSIRGAPAVDGHGIVLQSARYNGRLFPRCSMRRLAFARTTSVCPSRSIVGSGHAVVFCFMCGPPSPVPAIRQFPMTAINGGDRVILVWQFPNAPQARNQLAGDGQIQSNGGVLLIGWNDPARMVTPFATTVIEWHLTLGATVRSGGGRRGIIEFDACRNGRFRAIGTQVYEPLDNSTRDIAKSVAASVACTSA
jgi:hypothetical protein